MDCASGKSVLFLIRTAMFNLVVLGLAAVGTGLSVWAQRPATPAPEAVIDLEADRQMLTPVSTSWRMSGGDEARWADPAFDDSTWKVLHPRAPWDAQGFSTVNSMSWVRFRLRVPAAMENVVLLVPSFGKAYQIFADGQLVGQAGSLPPDEPKTLTRTTRIFTLPLNRARHFAASQSNELLVSIRMWHDPRLVGIIPNLLPSAMLAGSPEAVGSTFALLKDKKLLARGNDYTQSLITLIVGVSSLLLFLLTRRGFYIWFTFAMLADALTIWLQLISEHFGWGFFAEIYGFAVLDFLAVFTYVLFLLSALNLLRWRLAVPLTLLSFFAEFGPVLFILGIVSQTLADGIYFFCSTIPEVAVVLLLVRGWRKDVPYARLLLFPYVISFVISAAANLGHYLVDLDVPHASVLLTANLEILSAPFVVNLSDVGAALSNVGMLAVLVYQFAQSSREEQRLKTALMAAHDIQQSLVPVDIPSLGGLHTEIVYLAAEEVGGDFCQVLPRPDDSILVVIGDVSGKGLKAAMVGTLAVGALRSMADEEIGVGEILMRLNAIVLRTPNQGFITCLCMIITSHGNVTLANAGHLSPYLDGTELAVPPGLPLGITHDVTYEQSFFALPSRARLTLMSDGVAEARSHTGELYGFERTSRISRLLAKEIAAEANRFGQEDDITVITLDWHLPVAEMAVAV